MTPCIVAHCAPQISQARILEWIAISSSRGFSHSGFKPRSPALQADSLLLSHQGNPVLAQIPLQFGEELLLLKYVSTELFRHMQVKSKKKTTTTKKKKNMTHIKPHRQISSLREVARFNFPGGIGGKEFTCQSGR